MPRKTKQSPAPAAKTVAEVKAQIHNELTAQGLKEILPALRAKYGHTDEQGPDVIESPLARREYEIWKFRASKARAIELGINPKEIVMAEVTEKEAAAQPKVKKEKETPQKPESAKTRSTSDVETEHGPFRKGSVLHAIYRSFQLKEGATKAEILERLVKEFPDRKPEHLTTTINCQIARMGKERGFELGRDEKGRYSIHIKGRATNRILSPEAQAKLEAKRKEKEEAAAKAKAEKEAARKAVAEDPRRGGKKPAKGAKAKEAQAPQQA